VECHFLDREAVVTLVAGQEVVLAVDQIKVGVRAVETIKRVDYLLTATDLWAVETMQREAAKK
jgi:hypothetical protein